MNITQCIVYSKFLTQREAPSSVATLMTCSGRMKALFIFGPSESCKVFWFGEIPSLVLSFENILEQWVENCSSDSNCGK